MNRFILVITALLMSSASWGAAIGEITDVQPGGLIRFYRGEETVSVGEELFILNSDDKVNYLARVTSVNGDSAEAKVISTEIPQYGHFDVLRPGLKLRLHIEPEKAKTASFFFGPDFAAKTGDFGGTNYALGLQFIKPLNADLLLNARLEADDLGKDSAGFGKRKAYFMVGVGTTWSGFQGFLDIGIVDVMTIPPEGSTPKQTDPYTGATYPSGVNHTEHLGGLLAVQRPFILKPLSRTNRLGYGLTPGVSYAAQIGDTAYGPIAAVYLNLDLIFF